MIFVSQSNLSLQRGQIAVAISPGAFGAHLGIVFESAKDGRDLLHLAFHLLLRTEPFPPASIEHKPTVDASSVAASADAKPDDSAEYAAMQIQQRAGKKVCWIATVVDLPDAVSKVVVGIARAVSKRAPKIHFGIDFIAAKGSFDSNGAYRPPKGSHGLTCASFVNELFGAAAVPLVEEATWESKADYEEWRANVVALLRQHKADESHIEAVLKSSCGIRLCPEELAASAASAMVERPMTFKRAQELAPEVMAVLQTRSSCNLGEA